MPKTNIKKDDYKFFLIYQNIRSAFKQKLESYKINIKIEICLANYIAKLKALDVYLSQLHYKNIGLLFTNLNKLGN